ncbi:DUF1656 domain-containing protein [Pseudomonas sp. 21LCFQ02]|uniref:DUF1656 domain-containing protein n=1 Tax=unclassified Pseudomonas TaxID=196821 RepID=UPI0004F8C97A|nr:MULTISPECIES: DUF1656 domain-containing protein [unclassified Pseudomonas]MCO8163362.1 DUF1656 domain-containing protein [Pseudomonas sp. 21LCFQ010]MCO8167384.1 DUF1656 domain-containing protein [Pseudomonas sp. 21LCFQ02]MCQ9424967.1 DUF1656 domain-containing protein [Pseudomonas sp. LJDD11]BAP44224.1 membrane protein [Pseudomonas sp. StFLB209]
MIGELDINGIFIPTFLVLMGLAYLLFLAVHAVLSHTRFYRLVWHRALFNTGLYALLLGVLDTFSRYLMT